MNNKSFISNQTICLLCGFKPLVVKKFIIERHFRTRHLLEYSNYSNTEKLNIIEGLKLVYQEGALPPSINSSSQKSVLASYAISLLIAQNAKPFSEGVFVKNCIIEAVKAFGNSLTLEEAMSIPLSSKTNDFSCVEELLDFVPLHGTTTGLDIFLAVQKSLQKFGVDLNKCSSITTDDARNMTGLKIGFAGQLKQRNSNIPVIQCIIHQEALSGKVVQLSTIMATVSKIINLIKGGHKFLTHRKFQLCLQEHNAVHTDVPLHCPVRWLSAAKYAKGDKDETAQPQPEMLLQLQQQVQQPWLRTQPQEPRQPQPQPQEPRKLQPDPLLQLQQQIEELKKKIEGLQQKKATCWIYPTTDGPCTAAAKLLQIAAIRFI
ncbi:general transcription factor II-I repeat domain-containing protein 2-like [Osmia bicornis bicornis]|uniref:general transcription factor II-I repeat domain-containing protein 2-like n=1 Tax=Osmia bicornis bicornis TaxID=1437191 RepID=UPI001EAF364A|nr:general transcription factor II-I repeat domain-containing protein 2-like [Osmia bicornis bicornis]